MNPRGRRLVAPMAVGGAALLGVVYLGAVDPNEPGHYPLCPTQALLGVDCPGCGGLRCVHALARGDVVGALDHNALAVLVLLPLAVITWALWLRRAWRGPALPGPGVDTLEPAPSVARPGAAGAGAATAVSVTAVAVAPARAASTTWVWALVALLAVFTVARNIEAVPWMAWLGSGAA
jgi:hypothetical protein